MNNIIIAFVIGLFYGTMIPIGMRMIEHWAWKKAIKEEEERERIIKDENY